jgi:hypothetical protein
MCVVWVSYGNPRPRRQRERERAVQAEAGVGAPRTPLPGRVRARPRGAGETARRGPTPSGEEPERPHSPHSAGGGGRVATALAVRSTATLRRLALLLSVAAKLVSQRLETPLLLPRLPRLPSCSPLMLPRQPHVRYERESNVILTEAAPQRSRCRPQGGRRPEAAGKRAWRAEGIGIR